MTTPAGWYDDGSGRQRWWDGQQWTEHFAPEVAAAPAPEMPTVEVPAAADAAPVAPPYAAPAAPAYAAAPEYAAGHDYSAAPGYAAAPGGYPGYQAATAPAETKPSVLGLVGFGLGVVGTILVFIPLIGAFGFVLLAAAFICSLISLFLKGKKWPGITGLALAVVGTIIGIIMALVFFAAFAKGVSDEIDKLPHSSSSDSPADPDDSADADDSDDSDGSVSGTGRPTVDEVAVGIKAIIALTGQEDSFTESYMRCFAEEFVDSDISDETLRTIADVRKASDFTDVDAAKAFSEELLDAVPECVVVE